MVQSLQGSPVHSTHLPLTSMFDLHSVPRVRGAVSKAADLVDDALSALDADLERARVALRRVSALLKSERDGAHVVGRGSPRRSALAPWQVREVTAHIESHIETALSLDELARITRLSKGYFSRAFKRSFLTSPHDYIVRRRVERAQAQMLKTSDSLCQVALSCGFADQPHFSRVFRRVVGCSPLEWRRTPRVAG